MVRHKSVELHPFCLFTVQSGEKNEYLQNKMQAFAENLAKPYIPCVSLRKVQISISNTNCILRGNKSKTQLLYCVIKEMGDCEEKKSCFYIVDNIIQLQLNSQGRYYALYNVVQTSNILRFYY